MSNNEVFLGRSGRAFGPYTTEEFETFKRNGKIAEFSWIWSETEKAWDPLDPPPPPLSAGKGARGGKAATTDSRPTFRHDALLPLEAICHDRQSAVSGKLRLVTETGCELVSPHPIAEAPFGEGRVVLINLLDPKSGKSVDTQAKILHIKRKEGAWTFELAWKKCPELVHECI